MTRRTLTFVGEVGDEQRRVAEVVRAPLVVAAGPEHEAGRRRVVRVAQAAQQVARAVGVCVAVAFAHAACQKNRRALGGNELLSKYAPVPSSSQELQLPKKALRPGSKELRVPVRVCAPIPAPNV